MAEWSGSYFSFTAEGDKIDKMRFHKNTRNSVVGIPTALWGEQCMHCWSPQCTLYAELRAYMRLEGEDYRRACCLFKKQHADYNTSHRETCACWCAEQMPDSEALPRTLLSCAPRVRGRGPGLGSGFLSCRNADWLSRWALLQSPYYFCHLSPQRLQPLNIHDVK